MKTTMTKKNILMCIVAVFLLIAGIALAFSAISPSSISAYAMEQEGIDASGEKAIVDDDDGILSFESESDDICDIMMISGGSRSSNAGIISGSDTPTLLFTDLSNVHYIPNANYFLINPWHHDNTTNTGLNAAGVCASVSLQMLMGYHNYYSDRRIIPTSFLDSTYGNLGGHPSFSRARVSGQGCLQIGTTDGFFHELYEQMLWPNFPLLGQAIGLVQDTGWYFMLDNTPQAAYNNISLTSGYSQNQQLNQILTQVDQLF